MTSVLTILGALVPVLLGAVAVLFYRSKAQVAEAQLSAATQAAAGAADRAQQLEGALSALRAKIDDATKTDHAAGDAAKADPTAAGGFLRDSLRGVGLPGNVPGSGSGPAQGLLSGTARAHAPRYVAGFGRSG